LGNLVRCGQLGRNPALFEGKADLIPKALGAFVKWCSRVKSWFIILSTGGLQNYAAVQMRMNGSAHPDERHSLESGIVAKSMGARRLVIPALTAALRRMTTDLVCSGTHNEARSEQGAKRASTSAAQEDS
jgi:hypothetical protein